METQILKDVQEIKNLLSKLIGTSELHHKQKFSKESLDKAAKEFRNLEIKRGEWIEDYEISKIIRKAPYYSGKFIIEKFDFINYFKQGRTLYFNKKDITALKNELKKRNINLGKYVELLNDQEKFNKNIDSIKKKKGKHFNIPYDLKDIETTPYNPPSMDIVKNHLASLKEEFERDKLEQFIDIYKDSYAMFKFEYHFDRYLTAQLKKQCKNWCFEFNYANTAMREIKKIKSYYY